MAITSVMYGPELEQLSGYCDKLCVDAAARAVLLIERSGQFITGSGETAGLDTTSLASLAAGNVAATSGLAELLGERAFPTIFHEGERDNLYMSTVQDAAILVVVFDARASLGLVRLRVKRCIAQLLPVFDGLNERITVDATVGLPLGDVNDGDIDQLFEASGLHG